MTVAETLTSLSAYVTWITTALALLLGSYALTHWRKWRREAARRLLELQTSAGSIKMKRNPFISLAVTAANDDDGDLSDKPVTAMAREVSIVSAYAMKRSSEFNITSLGRYLASLEPVDRKIAGDEGVDRELEIALGRALVRLLGPTAGPAFLPALGMLPGGFLDKGMEAVALAASLAGRDNEATLAGAFSGLPSHLVRAVGGMSMMTMSGTGDVAAAVIKGMQQCQTRKVKGTDEEKKVEQHEEDEFGSGGGSLEEQQEPSLSPIDITVRGEIREDTFPPNLIPNPFVLSKHWSKAIEGMEEHIRQTDNTYDPNDYPMSEASPIHDDMLPDLHIGMGGIPRTHTKREVLQNRLFAVLLNKLSMNDILEEFHGIKEVPTSDVFVVQMNDGAGSKPITRPCAFVEALMQSGHTAKAMAASRTTTFGLALCVKEKGKGEKDATKWSHIPLGVCLRTGLQDINGDSIPAFLTHSSIDVHITGPVVNGLIQYYHSQEGMACWQSGDYPNAPWSFDAVERPIDVVRAVRMSGFNAAILNSVATRHHLPMAGYGLLGVCNDSAAAVEQAVRGKTDMYPLIAMSGYFNHAIRRADELHDALEKKKGSDAVPKEVLKDLTNLRKAMYELPNDIHPTPSTTNDTLRRISACVPDDPHFDQMVVGKTMAEGLLRA